MGERPGLAAVDSSSLTFPVGHYNFRLREPLILRYEDDVAIAVPARVVWALKLAQRVVWAAAQAPWRGVAKSARINGRIN